MDQNLQSSHKTKRIFRIREHLIPLKYEDTGIHFISQQEFYALLSRENESVTSAYTYIMCLDMIRNKEAGSAGYSEDGLLNFIDAAHHCLAFIEHPQYGQGRVIKIADNGYAGGQMLTIAFGDNPPKTFDTRWAPITWKTQPIKRRKFFLTQKQTNPSSPQTKSQ